MQDKENVTVVIPTHNNAGTIKRALDSATKGIRPANQVIIGDNDSKDGTYDVLCNMLKAEPVTIDDKTGLPPQFDGEWNGVPVKIFRKQLSTIGHTINVAMQLKWQGVTIFGFLNATSWYAPDKIAQSIRAFNSHPSIACVISDCDEHYPDGHVERVFRCSFDMQRLLAEYTYDMNFLLRTSVFPKLKSGFNEHLQSREDYDLLLRISEVGLIYHIPAPLHNNMVLPPDDNERQIVLQSEAMVRQLTNQRRQQPNG